MGNIIDACKAFWRVLTGDTLVPRSELEQVMEELKQVRAATESKAKEPEPDRFAEGAVYSLLLMQREGRLIDFLQENLDGYADEQIGTAVRQIHKDCAAALTEHFAVKAVLDKSEGEAVALDGDSYDATTIKLVGNVPEAPPYKGTLQHKGWIADKVDLPERTGKVNPYVIQPAEVEV